MVGKDGLRLIPKLVLFLNVGLLTPRLSAVQAFASDLATW